MNHDKIVELVKNLPPFGADNIDYIDFDEYTVPHVENADTNVQTYSCWTYTLCFKEDMLVGNYHSLKINTPNGWAAASGVPAEHKETVMASLNAFVESLIALGLPKNLVALGEAC